MIESLTPHQLDYREYLRSEHWLKEREAALARAGWRCAVCNDTEKLQVHHRTYERVGNELPTDLTVLCDTCHELFSINGRLKPGPIREEGYWATEIRVETKTVEVYPKGPYWWEWVVMLVLVTGIWTLLWWVSK